MEFLENGVKWIIGIPAMAIIGIIFFDLFKEGKKRKRYMAAIIGIFIEAIFINTILKELLKASSKNDSLNKVVETFYNSTKGEYINAYTIVFSFLIIAYFNTKINALNYPNKKERGIWKIYSTSSNALEIIELMLNIDNNKIKKLVEDEKENSKKKIRCIVEEKWKLFTKNDCVKFGNILIEVERYNKKKLFVKLIKELNENTEKIMMIYKDYLDDKLFRDIAQINYESSRYDITRLSKKRYDEEMFIVYLTDLLYYLNKVNEKWYEYYKKEIKRYRRKNILTKVYILNGSSLRKTRIKRGISIEELCYRINNINGENNDIKTEILYRLIENGEINPNEDDIKAILKSLNIENLKDKYFTLKRRILEINIY